MTSPTPIGYWPLRPGPTRVLVLAVTVAIGFLAGCSTGWASCGDYLVHRSEGLVHGSEGIESTDPLVANVEGVLVLLPDRHDAPPMACVGGRCRSLPWLPTPGAPSSSTSKLIASADAEPAAVSACGPRRWLDSFDGLLPPQPWLEIEIPPPRFSHQALVRVPTVFG